MRRLKASLVNVIPGVGPHSLLAFGSLLLVPEPAYAYLDPGSVSLALQAIVAALAGAALTWRHWYWRVRSFLGLGKKRESEPEESAVVSEDATDRSDDE